MWEGSSCLSQCRREEGAGDRDDGAVRSLELSGASSTYLGDTGTSLDPNLCDGCGEQGLGLQHLRGRGAAGPALLWWVSQGSPDLAQRWVGVQRCKQGGGGPWGWLPLRKVGDEGLQVTLARREEEKLGWAAKGCCWCDWWQSARPGSRCDSVCPRCPEFSHVLPGTSLDSSPGDGRIRIPIQGGNR